MNVVEEPPVRKDGRYWFPAKRYGWGWGPPTVWQGWLVLLAFFGLLALGAVLLPPAKSLVAYLVYVVVLCLALVGACWLKGEPPRWRWGEDEPK
jgi:hypothetical protein